MPPLVWLDSLGELYALTDLYCQVTFLVPFSKGTEYPGVVGCIRDKRGNNYRLFLAGGEVVIMPRSSVSWILDVNWVEQQGAWNIWNVSNWGNQRLILLVS